VSGRRRKTGIYGYPSVKQPKVTQKHRNCGCAGTGASAVSVPRRKMGTAMIFTTRDLDILRFLRWCRFVLAEDLTSAFYKAEVQNLEILRLIKLYSPAQAYTLTAAGNRLLDTAFPKLPAAVAPAYKAADTIRRIRQAKLMLTVYHAGVSVFTTDVSALCEQAMFLPMIARNRGANPWGSTRVAALLHTGNLMCAIHWVSPGIGRVALTDELTAFQNHTAAIPAKQRAMIFAASSYEEILAELDAGQKGQNTRLQTYREVYDCLKLPLFLLPCNGTGCLQLRILSVPNYRELLARIILKSHYVLPPANRTMYDALYQGVPFIMAADMNLRRIDAAVEVARSDSLSQIVLAALPEQVETVLNRRYRETGKARVFTITDAALRELLGSTAPYTPPDLPFYTSEGSVLDVPPLKSP